MIIKGIRTFLLLISGLAFIAHLIIPHDHHLSATASLSGESCPFSHQNPHNHPLFPLHCHAFNDLVAEKFTPVVVQQVYQANFVAVIWRPANIFAELIFPKPIAGNSGKQFQVIFIPDVYPLRAPPLMS